MLLDKPDQHVITEFDAFMENDKIILNGIFNDTAKKALNLSLPLGFFSISNYIYFNLPLLEFPSFVNNYTFKDPLHKERIHYSFELSNVYNNLQQTDYFNNVIRHPLPKTKPVITGIKVLPKITRSIEGPSSRINNSDKDFNHREVHLERKKPYYKKPNMKETDQQNMPPPPLPMMMKKKIKTTSAESAAASSSSQPANINDIDAQLQKYHQIFTKLIQEKEFKKYKKFVDDFKAFVTPIYHVIQANALKYKPLIETYNRYVLECFVRHWKIKTTDNLKSSLHAISNTEYDNFIASYHNFNEMYITLNDMSNIKEDPDYTIIKEFVHEIVRLIGINNNI